MPRFDPATPLVHPLPGPERAEVRPGLVYAEAGGRELAMDLYLPAARRRGRRGAGRAGRGLDQLDRHPGDPGAGPLGRYRSMASSRPPASA